MVSILIALIVALIVLGVGYWAVTKLGAAFGLPSPIIAVCQVIMVILALVIVLERTSLF